MTDVFGALAPGIRRCRLGRSAMVGRGPPARDGATGRVADAHCAKIAVAGLDIIMDADGEFRLLELNNNPAMPPWEGPRACTGAFKQHLEQMTRSVLELSLALSRPQSAAAAGGGGGGGGIFGGGAGGGEDGTVFGFKPLSEMAL